MSAAPEISPRLYRAGDGEPLVLVHGFTATWRCWKPHGNPIPFLRKGSRDELEAATGDTKLPTLKLADGTVIKHSKEILAWVRTA